MAWQSSAVVVDPPLARDVGALWEHRVNISADRLCRTEKLQKAQRVGGPVAGELGFEPRFSESESDVLPLNYSPSMWRKWLLRKEKSTERRENKRRYLVAFATICSRDFATTYNLSQKLHATTLQQR